MKLVLSAALALIVLCTAAFAAPADTTLRFDPASGLFTIKRHTFDAVKADFVFWSGEWKWVDRPMKARVEAPFDYAYSAKSRGSAFSLQGRAARTASNEMQWAFSLSPWNAKLYPSNDRASMPGYVAAVAGFQAWSVPLESSKSILVSMSAQTVRGEAKGKRVSLSEPVAGRLSLAAAPGLKAYAAFPDGRLAAFPARHENGTYIFDLDRRLKTYWLVLKSE